MFFNDKIVNLINTKREGNYWDFKKEPHSNNAKLLHDILCLANSKHKGERYIIFGVTDPSETCKIIGLRKNQKNRKTQTDIIDFLRSKKFAGDFRPEVELHTINISDVDIDILVIFDHPYKPYYLTENYRHNDSEVKAYHIYTRNNDMNTPLDSSADIYHIEQMWRQRFGLDLTPVEKMKCLLMKPNDWYKNFGNVDHAYNKEFPEYKIEFSDPKPHKDVFSYFYSNDDSYIGKAVFKYYTTPLFELDYIFCDEMRLILSYPKVCAIKLTNMNWSFYYNKSELDGIFLYFLTNGTLNTKSRGIGAPFILVENKAELNKFIEFAINNENRINEIEPSFYAKDIYEKAKYHHSSINPVFLSKIKTLFDEWKST